ncbi:L-galactonate transporter (plasmid) [Streptomyces rimosus subsp. rimosus]|nr:L-galactonate transporter [Streptomyces rimosus subsp. rimosus]UTH99072.1 L-galactonate transporter [Streptomyces rimosus subsp. rimosus]UTI00501.1 L-galactonate transporter [Streptomyces rimosus subsp. rimosus]UTJ17170.1 L-galactonate transporter [Streptomyces rimosus subsp. rimosus]UTJ18598.1 L-galactonate transporter [Streptomyces rimosus subsp. rimosus]
MPAQAESHETIPAPETPETVQTEKNVRRRFGGFRYLLGRKRAGGADHAPWRSLRYRSMRWWSVANLVSNAGTWMQLTVQNLLVLQLTGSAAATGLSLSVQAGPGLIMGLFGGAAVDRWPRKLTAGLSQAVLGLVAFTTAALVATGQLNYGMLMALAAVTGLVATVDGPATALLGNDLVRREDVPSAIAVGSLVHSVGRLGGTALAGIAVGFLGTGAAYAANGVSFLFVAAVIPFLKPVSEALRAPAKSREGTEETVASVGAAEPEIGDRARDGLAFFMRRPRLVALAAITGLSAIFGRNYQLTLAVLVTGPLAAGAGAFGTVSSVLAAGGIVGAILAARLRNPSVKLVGALAAAGALLQVFAGLSPSLIVLLVLVLPMSVVESVSDTAGTTVLQTDPPPNMRGRVLGVWRSASTVWGLVAPPLLGLLMEVVGARGALVAGGLIIAVAIGAGALLRSRERISWLVPAPAPAMAADYRSVA